MRLDALLPGTACSVRDLQASPSPPTAAITSFQALLCQESSDGSGWGARGKWDLGKGLSALSFLLSAQGQQVGVLLGAGVPDRSPTPLAPAQ